MHGKNVYLLILFCSFSYISATFDNILLMVNYNHEHYESIPLLKKIYAPYFKNIIFYGPNQHPEVHQLAHHKGYFSYLCIADAMQKYPEYDGYLFLMDDCILHPWLIKDLDTSKIWNGFVREYGKTLLINTKSGPTAYWMWWTTQWGSNPTIATFNELNQDHKNILQKNCGKDTVLVAFSDFVYIPAQFKNQFLDLCQIFGKHKVFLEIALPTMLACISSIDDWIWLSGENTPDPNPLARFDKNATFNHPIKLSYSNNRLFVDEFFSSVVE